MFSVFSVYLLILCLVYNPSVMLAVSTELLLCKQWSNTLVSRGGAERFPKRVIRRYFQSSSGKNLLLDFSLHRIEEVKELGILDTFK